jgi:hypothetical protein
MLDVVCHVPAWQISQQDASCPESPTAITLAPARSANSSSRAVRRVGAIPASSSRTTDPPGYPHRAARDRRAACRSYGPRRPSPPSTPEQRAPWARRPPPDIPHARTGHAVLPLRGSSGSRQRFDDINPCPVAAIVRITSCCSLLREWPESAMNRSTVSGETRPAASSILPTAASMSRRSQCTRSAVVISSPRYGGHPLDAQTPRPPSDVLNARSLGRCLRELLQHGPPIERVLARGETLGPDHPLREASRVDWLRLTSDLAE